MRDRRKTMENKDKEYAEQRENGKNISEKAYLPRGGLEAELNYQENLKMTKRILYGDDNEQNRNALARALRLRKYEVESVGTPQEFVAKAKANSYHALITDLEYTENGREGYEILRQVRGIPALKILFSGVAGFEHEAEAYESGADFAVMKKDSSALVKLLDEKLNSGGENGR